jgi:hypothetical protein
VKEFTDGLEQLNDEISLGLTRDQIHHLSETIVKEGDKDGDGNISKDELMMRCRKGAVEHANSDRLRSAIFRLAVFVCVGLPILAVVTSATFGFLMSWVEGWPLMAGQNV